MVGANDVEKETGGKAFEEEEIKELCGIKGKDKDGNNFKLEDFKIDEEQLKAINEAKTSKNTGKFPLTYETPGGGKVTVEVLLTGTVEISFDTNGGSRPPEMRSTDSGKVTEQNQVTTETPVNSEQPVKTEQPVPDWEYSKRMKSEQTVTRTAKTGDETKVLYLFMIFGVSLTGAGLIYKKMK